MPPLPSSISSRSESSPSHIVNHNISNGGDSSRRNHQQKQLVVPTAIDVRINDLVGNGISGVLQKWVNYGRGWRHRWFVLQDGVLSYYKIHGPDKIVINPETEKGFKVIGDESMRIISRNRNSHHSQHQRKAFGEIHLKVPLLIDVLFIFFSHVRVFFFLNVEVHN
jgi:hypothetical protein